MARTQDATKLRIADKKLHFYKEEEKKKQKQAGGPSSLPNDEQEQTDALWLVPEHTEWGFTICSCI